MLKDASLGGILESIKRRALYRRKFLMNWNGGTVVAELFVVEDIKRLLALVSDPWDNLYELSQKI